MTSALSTVFWIRLGAQVPPDADLRAAASWLSTQDDRGAVMVVPAWADRARLFVPGLADLDAADIGIEDLQGATSLWVLAEPGLPRSSAERDLARLAARPFLWRGETRPFGSVDLVHFQASSVRFALPRDLHPPVFREVNRRGRPCLLLGPSSPSAAVDVTGVSILSGSVGIVTSLSALDRSKPDAALQVRSDGNEFLQVPVPSGDESFHRFQVSAPGTRRIEVAAMGLEGRTLCLELVGW